MGCLMGDEQLPLTYMPGHCDACWDSGVTWSPARSFMRCVKCHSRNVEFSAAALRLSETIWQRIERKQLVDAQAFDLARFIMHATIQRPVMGYTLQGHLRATEREIKKWVRLLRREWLLPVGALRKDPYGYYWIRTAAEYLDWSRASRAQAIDELVTLHRNGQHNFPELVGQADFDFVHDFKRQIEEALI
jgi:hypothetical protein